MSEYIFIYEDYKEVVKALRNIDRWIKDTGTWLPYIEHELKNVEKIIEELEE